MHPTGRKTTEEFPISQCRRDPNTSYRGSAFDGVIPAIGDDISIVPPSDETRVLVGGLIITTSF